MWDVPKSRFANDTCADDMATICITKTPRKGNASECVPLNGRYYSCSDSPLANRAKSPMYICVFTSFSTFNATSTWAAIAKPNCQRKSGLFSAFVVGLHWMVFVFFFWDKSGPKILRNTRLNSTRRLISASVVHFANSCWPSLPIEQNFLLARYAGAKWCNSTVAKRMSLIVTEWVFELPSLLIAHQKCNISVYSTPPYYIWVVCNP